MSTVIIIAGGGHAKRNVDLIEDAANTMTDAQKTSAAALFDDFNTKAQAFIGSLSAP